MKTFRQILSEVAQPSSEDELNFKEKHVIDHILDPNSEEDQFTADEIKKFYNRADYKKGEDMAVYEGVTLARRDLPGQEDDDVNNDGLRGMIDAQLKYRRHAQIRNKIIDEGAKFTIPESILATEKNAFHTAAANAHKAGKSHFVFMGKKYPVTMSKDAAKTFAGKGKGTVTEQYLREADLKDFKAKHVPGLYSFDHFEHPNGSFIQISPHGHGVYRDEKGKFHEFHSKEQLKDMFAHMNESKMTDAQMKKREEIVLAMKKDIPSLKKKYGKDWEGVMYAIATKQAMAEECDPKPSFERARARAVEKKLQQEGLMDVIQPIGGEYGDEEKSHVAYKKKNAKKPDHHGEPLEVRESRNLQEISKKTLGSYVKKAVLDREALHRGAIDDAKMGRMLKDFDKKAADKKFVQSGQKIGKAANRRAGIEKAVDRLAKEDVSQIAPKTGSRIYAGKTKQSSIAEQFVPGLIEMADGSYVNVVAEEAKLLNFLFSNLDESNRMKMEAVTMSCEDGFNSIVAFASEMYNG